jgi:hypothetical protein
LVPTQTTSAAPRCIDGSPARTSVLVVSVLLLGASRIGYAYEEGAPPGHTGGFGEPDCSACHADSDSNSADGTLQVEGLPDEVLADSVYELAVVLKHAELRTGGFQLALRASDGKPSGQLVSLSDRTRVVEEAGQVYLQHTTEGLQPQSDGTARWAFRWIAAGAAGTVYLHVAANAANDDISALGDYIFTLERVIALETKQERVIAGAPVASPVAAMAAAAALLSGDGSQLALISPIPARRAQPSRALKRLHYPLPPAPAVRRFAR